MSSPPSLGECLHLETEGPGRTGPAALIASAPTFSQEVVLMPTTLNSGCAAR